MRRTVILRKNRKEEPPLTPTELILTCAGGIEPILEAELVAAGYSVDRHGPGAVHVQSAIAAVPDLCASLRTASRLLVPVDRIPVRDYDDLYRGLKRIPWERIIPTNCTFAIAASTRSSTMRDHRFLAMRAKDAIVDLQRDRTGGKRSSIDRDHPVFPVVIHLDRNDTLEVSLDAAGAPLHERGYRTEAGDAPLRETVAAAIVLQSGYDRAVDRGSAPVLVDPFCGSGTIAIEAALIAARRSPQPEKRRYAWQRWPWFGGSSRDKGASRDAGVIGEEGHSHDPATPRIFASDRDDAVVEKARRNARRAGVEDLITFSTGDFRDRLRELTEETRGWTGAASADESRTDESRTSGTPPMLVLANPPYGERLDDTDLDQLYRDLGDTLKESIPGGSAWILCSEKSLMQNTRLSAARRVPMYNGGLECRLYRLDIRADGRADG